MLPAVSLDGLMAVMAQPGSILRIDMEYFLESVLVSHQFVSASAKLTNIFFPFLSYHV